MKLLAVQKSEVVKRMIHKPESMNCSSEGFIPLLGCSGIKRVVKKEAFFLQVVLPAWCLNWPRRFVPGFVSLFSRVGVLVSITIQLS